MDQIFEGYVTSSKKNLRECIDCCTFWKTTYLHTSQVHRKYDFVLLTSCCGSCLLIAPHLLTFTRYSSHGWILDETSFFVVIDASIQRFKDLIEVRPSLTHRRTSGTHRKLMLLLLPLPQTRSVTVSISLPAGRTASRGLCPSLVAARALSSVDTCWRSRGICSGACRGCKPWTRASWTSRTQAGALSSTRRSTTSDVRYRYAHIFQLLVSNTKDINVINSIN